MTNRTGLACRPDVLPAIVAEWPEQLHRRWLPWAAVPRRNGIGKAPCGRVAGRWQLVDAFAPQHWLTVEEALHVCGEVRRERGAALAGVGMVLTPDLGVVCVDLDSAWQGARLSPFARDVATRLGGYQEASITNGIHILVRGQLSKSVPKRIALGAGQRLELLHRSYVTVTGRMLPAAVRGMPDRQSMLDELLVRHRQRRVEVGAREVRPMVRMDDHVLEAARRARPPHGARFRALYDHGAWEATGVGRSEADAALIATLLWHTGGDRERTLHLFRHSALYRPHKTDRVAAADGRSYGQLSVDHVALHLGYPG